MSVSQIVFNLKSSRGRSFGLRETISRRAQAVDRRPVVIVRYADISQRVFGVEANRFTKRLVSSLKTFVRKLVPEIAATQVRLISICVIRLAPVQHLQLFARHARHESLRDLFGD